jgi:UDP-glucose 4-epimerase
MVHPLGAWSDRRVLITGGAGFIGSHLVEHLLAVGATVTILDNLRTGHYANLAHPSDRMTLCVTDMLSLSWLELIDQGCYDFIFHFAANAYVPPSVEDPQLDYRLNLESTFYLLEALRKLEWSGKLIYASSAAVYGNPLHMPIREDAPTVPISPYGVGKLGAERYVAVYSQLYGLRAVSLRLFSTYGPRQRKQVVYDLIARVFQNPSELLIYGDGTQERDFCYVSDTTCAAMVVAESGAFQGEVYNVGSGRSYSIAAIAEMISQILGTQPHVIYSGSVRPGDPDRWAVDISRIQTLGYQPVVSIEEGLRRTVTWYQQAMIAG